MKDHADKTWIKSYSQFIRENPYEMETLEKDDRYYQWPRWMYRAVGIAAAAVVIGLIVAGIINR